MGYLRFLTPLLIAIAAAGCGPEASPPPFTADHRAALSDSIRAELERFSTRTAEGTPQELAVFYSEHPDFRFYESGRLQYESARGVREALAGLPPEGRLVTEFRAVEVQPVAPGVGVSHALYTTRAEGFGQPFSYGGAMTLVWVHEATGWRIRSGHSSAPVPDAR